jgi:hypothetical protein
MAARKCEKLARRTIQPLIGAFVNVDVKKLSRWISLSRAVVVRGFAENSVRTFQQQRSARCRDYRGFAATLNARS